MAKIVRDRSQWLHRTFVFETSFICHLTCDVTVTHKESAVGLAETY